MRYIAGVIHCVIAIFLSLNMKFWCGFAFILTLASIHNTSDVGNWKFTDITIGQTCILVKFDAQLNITYTTEREYLIFRLVESTLLRLIDFACFLL